MSKDLIKAYQTTIYDLEIAYRRTGFFDFKERKYLASQIEEYESKIDKLILDE